MKYRHVPCIHAVGRRLNPYDGIDPAKYRRPKPNQSPFAFQSAVTVGITPAGAAADTESCLTCGGSPYAEPQLNRCIFQSLPVMLISGRCGQESIGDLDFGGGKIMARSHGCSRLCLPATTSHPNSPLFPGSQSLKRSSVTFKRNKSSNRSVTRCAAAKSTAQHSRGQPLWVFYHGRT